MVRIPTTLKSFVRRVQQGINPTTVVLFGSRATGKARGDSDYDIIVVSPVFERVSPIHRATQVYRFHDGCFPLEVICLTPAEFTALQREPTIIREAVRQGIVLYKAM